MGQARAVALLAVFFVCGVSFSDAQPATCMVGTGSAITQTNCAGSELFCGRTETEGSDPTGACVADLAACDAQCAGDTGCVSACCDVANCNTGVATMRATVKCGTGAFDGTNFATAPADCTAGDLCGRKEVTPAGGTTTTTGSCSTVAECEALCDGETDACVSACCNDADTCNTRSVADMSAIVRCGSGADATAAMLTCTSGSLCGRMEVAGGATTGSCSTAIECETLCGTTENCVSACCNDADNCNTRTVAQMSNTVRCGIGASATASVMVCAAGSLCGRKEVTAPSAATTGSCSTQAECDALCAGTASCTAACCNNADNCNARTVAEMEARIVCGTGTLNDGAFPAATFCAADELCARTETTSGETTTIVGSCETQITCEGLCDSATGCISACCKDGDYCNTRSVADIDNVVQCGTGADATAGSMTCAAGSLCSNNNNDGTITGDCSTQDECDSLCAGTASCTSACCSDSDNCNTRTVVQIETRIRCGTGTLTGGAFPTATTCGANELCARTEITGGATEGSCQTQTGCNLLCAGVTGCTSACCNDGDFCNTLSVTNIIDVVRCGIAPVTNGAFTATMVCASGQQCQRTETTSGNTVTLVGSCIAGDATCGSGCTAPDCVASCCNDADGCNTLSVATQTARQCYTGTTMQVGSAAATGSLTLEHCPAGEMCGRKQTTTTSGDTTTVVTIGSCSTAAECNNGTMLCNGAAGCIEYCCDTDGCNSAAVTTTTTTTTTAAATTTAGAEHAAQINMLVMMGLVVLGWFMA